MDTALNTNNSARKSRKKTKQQTASPSKCREDSESQEDSDNMDNNPNVGKAEFRRSLSANAGMRNRKVNEPRHDKTNKVNVRPAETQISLGIHPV